MTNLRIITDSNAFLAPHLGERQAVRVIANRIKLLDEELEESAITADEIFVRLHGSGHPFHRVIPQAVSPQPEMITRILHEAESANQDVVAITMSRYLSPTFQAIANAAQYVQGVAVRVIDSGSVSMGVGLLVEEAVTAASHGASVMQVSRQVARTVPTLFVFFFAESMHYVQRSAHLPASQGLLGSLLRIKALLTIEEGRLHTVEKVQTEEQLVEKLFHYIVEFSFIRKVGVLHHAYQPVVDRLEKRLRQHDPQLTIVHLPYPPSLAIHLGPNMIGVIVQEDDL